MLQCLLIDIYTFLQGSSDKQEKWEIYFTIALMTIFNINENHMI